MWKEVGPGDTYEGAGLLKARDGGSEFLVSGGGEIFETIQLFVRKNLPPCAFRQVGRWFGGLPLGRVGSDFTECRTGSIGSCERAGPAIVRTHTATCDNHANSDGREDKFWKGFHVLRCDRVRLTAWRCRKQQSERPCLKQWNPAG